MAATVRGAIRELLEQTMATMDALLEASDQELTMPSSHVCAQGKDVWTLIANDIDDEKIQLGHHAANPRLWISPNASVASTTPATLDDPSTTLVRAPPLPTRGTLASTSPHQDWTTGTGLGSPSPRLDLLILTTGSQFCLVSFDMNVV